MTRPETVEALAKVLGAHVYTAGSDGRGCVCGWRRERGDIRPFQEQHAEKHLAAALLDAIDAGQVPGVVLDRCGDGER